MTKRRMVIRLALIVSGLALLAIATYLVRTDLDKADKLASVGGFLVGILGTAATLYGLLGTHSKESARSAQKVSSSQVGGNVDQLRGIAGSVQIGPASERAEVQTVGPQIASPILTTADEIQEVMDSAVGGDIRQVEDVGGDVDIDK